MSRAGNERELRISNRIDDPHHAAFYQPGNAPDIDFINGEHRFRPAHRDKP